MTILSYEDKFHIFCEELVQSKTLQLALGNAYKRGAIAQYQPDRKAYYAALALVGNPDERNTPAAQATRKKNLTYNKRH